MACRSPPDARPALDRGVGAERVRAGVALVAYWNVTFTKGWSGRHDREWHPVRNGGSPKGPSRDADTSTKTSMRRATLCCGRRLEGSRSVCSKCCLMGTLHGTPGGGLARAGDTPPTGVKAPQHTTGGRSSRIPARRITPLPASPRCARSRVSRPPERRGSAACRRAVAPPRPRLCRRLTRMSSSARVELVTHAGCIGSRSKNP